MRIGLFTHVYPPIVNGVAVSTQTLERELANLGHEVFVITNNYNSLANDFSNKKNLKVISLQLYYQNLRTPILYNPDLFKNLNDLHLDVIHSHSDFGIGLLSRIYSYSQKVPHIQTYHCNYIEYAINNFGNLAGLLAKGPVKLYTHYLSATTNRLISPSKENFRLLTNDFNIKRHIDLIPNGIDLSRFRDSNYQRVQEIKKQYGIQDKDFVLLVLSRLSKEKRISDIIKIIPYLNDCTNLKLMIVGGGPDEFNLKKLVSDLKLNNVIFTGEVEHNETPHYYKIADAFITNSIAETQGLTVIEALASSVPVICVDSPLYEDVVINDKNGLKYKSIDDLVKLIKNLYKNQSYLERIREHTELSVLKYSVTESAKKITDIYEDEIKKEKR